jgi:membrane fusion protein, multidrug efflux system
MKRSIGWGLAALVVIAAALGGWWKSRAATETPAEPAAPVATIKSELPRVQSIADTLDGIGDVNAGQVSGLSFARAGQVTELTVVVGDRFSKGAVLATLAPDPAVRQAYQAAVDGSGLAQREWDRQKQWLASHLATQSQVDAAEKAVRDAQGAVKALDEQGGGRGTSQWTAPFEGVVTTVSAMQGDRVQAGAPVLQVGRDDVLRVLIGIEPSERARVHAGTRVTLWPVLSPAAEARPIELMLSEVQNVVDPKTQLINVAATLPRGVAAQLAPGMKVRARLQVGAISAVAVPRNAVLTDEKGDYVFQVASGKAHRVAVTKRLDNGTLTAIDGVQDMKLPIVTEGNYELEDGMAVKDAAQ